MKKSFLFAVLIAAMTLAFTACDTNTIDSPLVGTWEDSQLYGDAPNPVRRIDRTVIFDGKGNFTYEYGNYWVNDSEVSLHGHQILKGSFTIKEDIVTVHYTSNQWEEPGTPMHEDPNVPEDEQMKYTINGNKLKLIRHYGTAYSEETYTKK